MNFKRLMAVGAMALVALCSSAAAQCGISTNDCCAVGSGPGCSNNSCCQFVCSLDVFCCNNTWDSICANEAAQWCDNCGGSGCGVGSNDCCTSSTLPFCADGDCCALVCSQDPYCCNTRWDAQCASEATAWCPSCGGTLACGLAYNDCCTATSTSTPFCSDEACCSLVCAVDSFCCTNQWDSQCASEATSWCTSCGGVQSCGNSPNSCCSASMFATPFCSDGGCCTLVCAVDPFCCNTAWDFTCSQEATLWCSSCGGVLSCGNSPNSCCVATITGTPFCSDGTCCTTVCGVDPYCCNTQWDGICADEAGDLCSSCFACGNGTQDCCGPGTNPYCADADCCATVCAQDPYCCNTRWDGICANEAAGLCAACAPPCPADLNGDGTVDGADLGILLANWGGAGQGDIDGSGSVDGADLGQLLANWGPC